MCPSLTYRLLSNCRLVFPQTGLTPITVCFRLQGNYVWQSANHFFPMFQIHSAYHLHFISLCRDNWNSCSFPRLLGLLLHHCSSCVTPRPASCISAALMKQPDQINWAEEKVRLASNSRSQSIILRKSKQECKQLVTLHPQPRAERNERTHACLQSASCLLCCTIQGLLPRGREPLTMGWVFLLQLSIKTTFSPKHVHRATWSRQSLTEVLLSIDSKWHEANC